MQAKINNTTTKRRTTKEERQSHVENWKKSGLSMSEYCRQNNVALANLSEWKNAILRESPQFKPIQYLSTQSEGEKLNNVVEILVDQRIKIRLQHVRDASLVINIAKGMLTCN